jgi:hypothetical protein
MAQHTKNKFPMVFSDTMCYNNAGAWFCLKTKDSVVCFDITTSRINMDNPDHRNRGEKVGNMLLLANGGKLKVSAASSKYCQQQ